MARMPSNVGHDCIQRAACAIQNLGQTGIIETVAGNGFRGFSGDGGPAREASEVSKSRICRPLGQKVDCCCSVSLASGMIIGEI